MIAIDTVSATTAVRTTADTGIPDRLTGVEVRV
jgi:hypothetical protein